MAGGRCRGPFWDEGRGRGEEVWSSLPGLLRKESPAKFASGPFPQHVYPGRKEGIENQSEGRHQAL